MRCAIRPATPRDLDAILTLLPRLAAFKLPERRVAEDLWQGDAALLREWSIGKAPQCIVSVATDDGGEIAGVAITQLRKELLSGAPSAHLEVLVVREGAEGRGIGNALVEDAEATAAARGAESITLHVFATNDRARQLYERRGYEAELLRYIKYLP